MLGEQKVPHADPSLSLCMGQVRLMPTREQYAYKVASSSQVYVSSTLHYPTAKTMVWPCRSEERHAKTDLYTQHVSNATSVCKQSICSPFWLLNKVAYLQNVFSANILFLMHTSVYAARLERVELENMISNIKVALASFDTTHKYKTKIRRKNLKPMCSKDGNKECTQTNVLDLQTCPYTEQVKMKIERLA